MSDRQAHMSHSGTKTAKLRIRGPSVRISWLSKGLFDFR